MSTAVQTWLMVGLLGGFTTFSSFALETFRLGESGQWAGAGLYVLLSNGVGLVATWVGLRHRPPRVVRPTTCWER